MSRFKLCVNGTTAVLKIVLNNFLKIFSWWLLHHSRTFWTVAWCFIYMYIVYSVCIQWRIQDFSQGGKKFRTQSAARKNFSPSELLRGGHGGTRGQALRGRKKSSDISKYRYLDALNSNYRVQRKNCDFLLLIRHLPITIEISRKLKRLKRPWNFIGSYKSKNFRPFFQFKTRDFSFFLKLIRYSKLILIGLLMYIEISID